ncbi:urease accessory protein UreF [Phaeobacter sp. B1627]|uniref:urease accessory protein UreF n=1 Tax=Phaeobacter sp. B1627 TaxID=2583809 RepID=UPI0011195FB2|nr:urease accessory protein UreF [Phaeobacter sp. B1627]TNJ44402.1 urease accessory protein UreF [Phaeobacter sp. B1627]
MTTDGTLLLMQWLSPAYPVGAFAYSHGLEGAVEAGMVTTGATLSDWLADLLSHGGARSDAQLLACAYRAETQEELAEIDSTARAFCPSAERLRETDLQGAAFCQTTAGIWGDDAGALTYPVAVGHAARRHDIPLELTLQMYLQAFTSNLIAAGQRLLSLGQLEAQQRLAALAPEICETARAALAGDLDDLHGATFAADIASMRHETQYSRIFRS